MVYTGLEKQDRLPRVLCEAIENEIEINCLFLDGFQEGNPLVCSLQEVANEISEELTEEELFFKDAVAKLLWKARVDSFEDPSCHPQYKEGMDSEVEEALKRAFDIKNEVLLSELPHVIREIGEVSLLATAA